MVGIVNIIAVAVPKGILLIEDAVVVSMPVKSIHLVFSGLQLFRIQQAKLKLVSWIA